MIQVCRFVVLSVLEGIQPVQPLCSINTYQSAGGAIGQGRAVSIAQTSEVDVVRSHVFVGGEAGVGGAQARGNVGARGELGR